MNCLSVQGHIATPRSANLLIYTHLHALLAKDTLRWRDLGCLVPCEMMASDIDARFRIIHFTLYIELSLAFTSPFSVKKYVVCKRIVAMAMYV